MVPSVGLQCVTMAFPGRNLLLFETSRDHFYELEISTAKFDILCDIAMLIVCSNIILIFTYAIY